MRGLIWRGAALIAVAACVGGTATAAARPAARAHVHARAARHSGPLSGHWSGQLSRQTSWGVQRRRMVIYINARETGGTWKLGSRCYGKLTLDSISDGYHHYLRHTARGARLSAHCSGGDVDCLKRAGAGLYDAVTSHLGGAWDLSGTLKRVHR